jgi:hypothetical protein
MEKFNFVRLLKTKYYEYSKGKVLPANGHEGLEGE